ncbi:MAG: 3-hydroxybutyryl-CoA dehydrogenase [Acidimicrobiia bacterium]|nr:3-hydroxybutyryl-CoA dehydrogenase [Acidimicrobiia bacterium]
MDGQSTDFSRVGVVGAGLMGSGVAEVCALAGLDTTVVEASAEAAEAGLARIDKSLARLVKAGKRTDDDVDAAKAKLNIDTDLEALSQCDLVIEAIVENEAAKVGLFTSLNEIVESPEAILASNTSSIPIMKLAMVTDRPENVVGIHFFNPVPVLPLVELVTSLHTSKSTKSRAEHFASQQLDKRVIVSQDRAGFIVNALLIPYLLSAIRMYESGFASKEDIDDGMVAGCAHPMGPLHLTDLIGLDTTMAVAESLYAEFKEPLYAPPPLLARMCEAGLLGRKSGRGFYSY